MTVYVESNFVLEIALGQQQSEAAERILEGAVQGNLALAIPSCSVFEPFSTVLRRGEKRRQLMSLMKDEILNLKRSRPHEVDVLRLEPVGDLFSDIDNREKTLLNETVQRLIAIADIIEVDAAVYRDALDVARAYDFKKMSDAIVCAAILGHLDRNKRPGSHLFTTRDAADFSTAAVVERYRDLECAIVYSFEECAQRLRLEASS